MRFLKIALVVLLVIGVVIVAGYFIMDEDVPQGENPREAVSMANKMLSTTGYQHWKDTRYVRWIFPENHLYIWDKNKNRVLIEWGDNRVLLNTNNQSGLAWDHNQELESAEKHSVLKEAWGMFCNDSFWLIAPYKVYDKGTKRSVVDLDNGGQGLKVTYTSGGVTPGDTYLWMTNKEGMPTAVKMWVSVIPVGGAEFSWTNWKTLSSGAKVATMHHSKLMDLELTGIQSGKTLTDVNSQAGLFAPLARLKVGEGEQK